MHPKGSLKKLQEKFVRVRIVDMSQVDIGLFDFDFDTTFSAFVLNAEERIYLRYGGRGDRTPTEYLSSKSMVDALERGLKLHERWQSGKLPAVERPEPVPATSYPSVRKQVRKKECVHCHHIAQDRADELIARPDFDRKRDVWLYPTPERLGLELSLANGLRVATSSGAARSAGLKKGDQVITVSGNPVHTFGDLQRELHQVPVSMTRLKLEVERKSGGELKTQELGITLPDLWRVTDINWRSIGHRMTPFPGFWSKNLVPSAKKKHGLPLKGFAGEVTKFWVNTPGKSAGMRRGDIVYSVNGVTESPLASNVMIYIRLHHKPGDRIELAILRGRQKMTIAFTLKARPW